MLGLWSCLLLRRGGGCVWGDLDNIHALEDASEDGVLVIEPWCLHRCWRALSIPRKHSVMRRRIAL